MVYCNLNRWKEKRDKEQSLRPSGALDRVYAGTNLSHRITCPSGRSLLIEKTANLADTVVWTPWDNFDEGDYSQFLCVEPGNVINRKLLAPREIFNVGQTLRVE